MKRILTLMLVVCSIIGASFVLSGSFATSVTETRADGQQSCQLSESTLTLSNNDYIFHSVTANATEELTVDISGADWLQFAGVPTSVAAGEQATIEFAANGPTAVSRTATVSFKGVSGAVTTLTVTQEPVKGEYSFPAKWNYDKTEASSSGWTTTHVNTPNSDISNDNAYITAVGTNNRKLTYSVTKSSIAVSGMYTGDYILFSVPSGDLKAGTDIDFFACIDAASSEAPKYWVCEIYDGGEWKLPKASDLYTNADGDTYTFYTKYFSSYQYAYPNHTFTLANDVTDGMVRVRCRVVGNRNGSDGTLSATNTGAIFMPRFYCSMAAYPGIDNKDVKKVGILGNSFTLYGIPYLLKEVARSQGHELDIRLHSKGSQTFTNHLDLERSQNVFNESGYDYVFLQEQSTTYSDYAQNPDEATVTSCKDLAAKFRVGSPNAKIILEHTWPFPNKTWYNFGTIDEFESNLHKGTLAVADAVEDIDEVSLIGCAFTKAYKLGLTDLWESDSKHPNPRGAYLKACVNYLTIFGEGFDDNAADCGLDSVEADFLRKVAEEIVLGTTPEYPELPKASETRVAVLFADMELSGTEFTATQAVKFPGVDKNTSINGDIFKVYVTEDDETTKDICSFIFVGEGTDQTDFSWIYKKSDGATRPQLNWSAKTAMIFNTPSDIALKKITMQCTVANYTGTLTCSSGEVSASSNIHTWEGDVTGVLTFKHPNNKSVRLQALEIEYEVRNSSTSGTTVYEDWDTYSDTWVAVDELGRKVAIAGDGVDRNDVDKDVCIGMFYYIWHGYHNEYDRSVTELLEENADNPAWGAEKMFHWDAKPWLGYYKGGDQYVISHHLQMLTDAGIDFLFLDVTNSYWYPSHVIALMNEIDRRTALGLKSPKLTFCLNTKTPRTLNALYDLFYKSGEYDRFWFYWDGKPLILADPDAADTSAEYTVYDEAREFFTFRHSWAWMGGDNPDCWSWLEFYPQEPGWTNSDSGKTIEQISVGVAQHAHSKIGKSYHNGVQPQYNEQGLCEETPYGYYFQEQWDRAMEVKAPVVMITQFNEWIAQRFVLDESTPLDYVRPGGQPVLGETYFIDAYNSEFNRDIEPSTHPLIRDNYYLQLVSNIRKYRGASKIPAPTVEMTIDINGPFSQWDAETLEYRDDPYDTEYTSATVQTSSTLKRPTNDIVRSKVTQDDANLYFYVQITDTFYPFEESDYWMRLLLNTDCDYTTGWGGYDYCVYKDPTTGEYSLMKNNGDFTWSTLSTVEYRYEGNEMHLRIPRTLLGLTEKSDIDFKWADNISDDPNVDIMTFISDGDVAPNGRFNYRYLGAADISGVAPVVADNRGDITIQVNASEVTITNTGNESREIEVYNTLGQLQLRRTLAPASSTTAALSSGVYILNSPNLKARKFIIR